MLASSSGEKKVKIFDKRKSKIVQSFDSIHRGKYFLFNNKSFLTSNCYHLDTINCVKWSPSGDMLASASDDKTVALLDFKTGKKLYTGKTSDRSKFSQLD